MEVFPCFLLVGVEGGGVVGVGVALAVGVGVSSAVAADGAGSGRCFACVRGEGAGDGAAFYAVGAGAEAAVAGRALGSVGLMAAVSVQTGAVVGATAEGGQTVLVSAEAALEGAVKRLALAVQVVG